MLDFEKVKNCLINALNKKDPNLSESEKLAIITHWLLIAHHSTSTNHKYNEFFTQCVKSLQGKVCENESSYGQESFLPGFVFSNFNVPFSAPKNAKFSFIDLFAGIGGFRLALQELGGECVFSSEWDKFAQETYFTNYGEVPFGDITKEAIKSFIPQRFDVLCADFPCQAFSIAGKRAGFEDTRGTLFFDVATIVKRHQPKIVFLENVKILANHDEGKTLSVIIETLEEIGYNVFDKILNASDFGLPQNRERIYIVAFKKSLKIENFRFPQKKNQLISVNDILEKDPQNVKFIEREDISFFKKYLGGKVNNPVQIGRVGKGRQGERIYHTLGHSITLSAYGGGVGAKTGLYLIDGKIRKLTLRECARLQGFSDNFLIHQNKNQAYKQFGNGVAINVLKEIGLEIVTVLSSKIKE